MTPPGTGTGGPDTPTVLTMSSWGSHWLVELSGSSESYWSRLRSRGRMKVVELVSGPGRIHARVADRRGEIHPIDIEVRRLSSGEREDVIVLAARRSGTLATLLDGSVPSMLIDEVAGLEIDLFPTPSDLRISCSCEEWTDPCTHAAAVLRSLADSIDRDPFILFELRGLPRSEMLVAIRRHRAPLDEADVTGPSAPPGIDPWEGWSIERRVPGLAMSDSLSESDPPAPVEEPDGSALPSDTEPSDTELSDTQLWDQCTSARRNAMERARALLRRTTPRDPGPVDGT